MCARTELIEIMEKSLALKKDAIKKLEYDLAKLKEQKCETGVEVIRDEYGNVIDWKC